MIVSELIGAVTNRGIGGPIDRNNPSGRAGRILGNRGNESELAIEQIEQLGECGGVVIESRDLAEFSK